MMTAKVLVQRQLSEVRQWRKLLRKAWLRRYLYLGWRPPGVLIMVVRMILHAAVAGPGFVAAGCTPLSSLLTPDSL